LKREEGERRRIADSGSKGDDGEEGREGGRGGGRCEER